MKRPQDSPVKGWYQQPGHEGETTLEKQLRGLHRLRKRAPGARVLDLGCAEGAIANQFIEWGAATVHALEFSKMRIEKGRQWFPKVNFFHADLNDMCTHRTVEIDPTYDIVLMLAIAQKLRDPEQFIVNAIASAKKYVAIRTPHWYIRDKRSGFKYVDIPDLMYRRGFNLIQETSGYPQSTQEGFDRDKQPDPDVAWLGIFRRVA